MPEDIPPETRLSLTRLDPDTLTQLEQFDPGELQAAARVGKLLGGPDSDRSAVLQALAAGRVAGAVGDSGFIVGSETAAGDASDSDAGSDLWRVMPRRVAPNGRVAARDTQRAGEVDYTEVGRSKAWYLVEVTEHRLSEFSDGEPPDTESSSAGGGDSSGEVRTDGGKTSLKVSINNRDVTIEVA